MASIYVTKQHVREFAALTFTDLPTFYDESTLVDTTGTLRIGDQPITMKCPRGKERLMRRQFIELIEKLASRTLEKMSAVNAQS